MVARHRKPVQRSQVFRKSPRTLTRGRTLAKRRAIWMQVAQTARESEIVRRNIDLFGRDPVLFRLATLVESAVHPGHGIRRGMLRSIRDAERRILLGELSQFEYHKWAKELGIPNAGNSPYLAFLRRGKK
ncbi:MAG: hypothetical protein JW772_01310 [Candidatus Diapherotrites archaeon]|nr:hypothetical protein [Candidatus Diapherotrites archaeon]